MELLASHSVCLLLLTTFITMLMVGIIMLTAVMATSDAARYISSLADPSSHISVVTPVDSSRPTNCTDSCTSTNRLIRRVDVRSSLIPVYLVVSLVSIALFAYYFYRRWRRESTSPQSAAPVQRSPEVHRGRLPGYSSQVTLPVYSPPPPPYPDDREWESGENIELPHWNHDRSPGRKAETQQPTDHASVAPS